MSARLPDETGLEKELCPALAGLPAQVKVLASETDNVVSLEELALRFLHRIQRQPTGLSIGGPRVVKALFRKRACPPPPPAPARNAPLLGCRDRTASGA